MSSKFVYIIVFFICLATAAQVSAALFGTDDLYFQAETVKSFQSASDEHILMFDEGVDFSIGDNQFKSSKAVIWLKSITTQYRGITSVEYKVVVCMPSPASVKSGRGSKSAGIDLSKNFYLGTESTIAEFDVAGEIFVTAENRIVVDPRQSNLYRDALIATGQLKIQQPVNVENTKSSSKGSSVSVKPERLNAFETIFGSDRSGKATATPIGQPVEGAVVVPRFRYPVNISGVGSEPVRISKEQMSDGSSVATILNRFYLWQKQDEEGGVMEFMADSAVIFYSEKSSLSKASDDPQKLLGDSAVKGVYFSGNCIMTQGQRTIRCSQMYYDFQRRQALAVNSVLKTYSEEMGIPMFLRADKMRQICQGKFVAENAVITSSEFYNPQIEMTASSIVATDEDAVDLYGNKIGKKYGRMKMKNVKFRQNDRTFFWLPFLSGPMDWAEIPIRQASFGSDSEYGFTAETEWYMARLLGMDEPEGVDSTFIYDYFGKRGSAVGTKIIYDRDDYFGNLKTYLIKDKGKDNLSRNRQDVESGEDLRGSVQFQHRHFLPYDWQMTLEASYMSDENFHESFFRSEYLTDKEQETLIHLKRIKDNWGFAILGKTRINNFYDQMEELPSVQYHLVGQSLFDDKFTLYNDSSAGRFRQRIGNGHTHNVSSEYFTAGSSRTELDMPLNVGTGRVVPYVAGTFGYDDRSGFTKGLVDGTNTGTFGTKDVFIAEAGVRASRQFWKVYENVQSEFWDLNDIRHIVKPYVSAAFFAESDNRVEQKNTANIGLLQRWQTKRGTGDKQRNVEWMRLDLNYTWVADPEDSPRRPDKYSYNAPFVPLAVKSAPDIFGTDAGQFGMNEPYGPQRNSFNADYIWRMSDTTAFMSDMNYDTQSNEVEQFNVGFARYRWPNLSYYVGARYLRSIEVAGEVGEPTENGSNAFVFAATYKINPRYMVSVTWQYDFDYGKRILREISLIRRYHRTYYGFTFSKDETLDRQAILFNIWPEGLGSISSGTGPSLGMDSPGSRDY